MRGESTTSPAFGTQLPLFGASSRQAPRLDPAPMDMPASWAAGSHFLGDMRVSFLNSTRNPPTASSKTSLLMEVLIVLMCLGAVTGNILVIVIVAATKTFHSVTSVLIINLAISDFLVGIGVMPFVAVSVMNSGWVSCTDLCLYVGYTSSVYCTASVLTLAAIALDRYYSIVDCLRYSSKCTVWRTGSAVVWIWLQAMLTSCPPLLGWSSVEYVAPMYSCAVNWSSSPSYTTFMAALSFLVPAAVILFCYVKIVKVARCHARRIHDLEDHLQRSCRLRAPTCPTDPCQEAPSTSRLVYYLSGRFVSEAPVDGSALGAVLPDAAAGPQSCPSTSSQSGGRRLPSLLAHLQSSGQHQHHSSNPHHGIVRLLLVISAFLLCWTPYIGVALVQAIETALSRRTSLVPPSAVTFSYWLVLFNSDINPLLYALLSQRFQGALRSLRRKLRARLGDAVLSGGGRHAGMEDEGLGCRAPCTLTIPHFRSQQSHQSATSERTTCRSSVFSLESDIPNAYREHLGSIFLPHSSSSSCSSSSSSSSPPCSAWQDSNGECACGKIERLQVPSHPQEGNRLPSAVATLDRQATFFYGEITVRVEHDVC
ncbi:5-hydroxytryptamine receptor 1D [Paramormyrops kingsleyae]|uniref:5-hydroxytryptamine receptor 1D n=1 Tax=Paramormyrops kingsleyae TaxID=1676925 RepID=UPI003B96D842